MAVLSWETSESPKSGEPGVAEETAELGARRGRDYLEGLKARGAEVWLGSERVEDVTSHPAIGPAARTLARLYDLRFDSGHRDFMLYPSPSDGMPVGSDFLIPKTPEDLERRRKSHKVWADATFGLMGRSTDFMSAIVTFFYINADYFEPFSDNVRHYYEYVRDNDLFLTHALVDPPVDRSKPPSQQADPYLNLGVVRETDAGLIVRGAKAVATAGPYADELLVFPAIDARPGYKTAEDRRYSIAFAIPVNTTGLRFICREPYGGGNRFDHPLSSRLDEMDSVATFDDVLVPWERVFVNQEPDLIHPLTSFDRAHGGAEGWSAIGLWGIQTAVRLRSKLQFAVGLARRGMELMKRD